MKINWKNDFTVMLLRLLVVYVAFMLGRFIFYFFNDHLIDPIHHKDIFSLLRGSLMFDTVSILYLNLPFIFLSLLPFRFREKENYQKRLFWVYMISNSLGLLVNFADVFYYPYKQSRLVLGDLFLVKEDSFSLLILDFMVDYWYGFIFYFLVLAMLCVGYRRIGYGKSILSNNRDYYVVNSAYLGVMVFLTVFLVRGASLSKASFPISMSDAFLYTSNASHTSLILSNPFCLFRTIGKSKKVPKLEYFDKSTAEAYMPTTHMPSSSGKFKIDRNTNVFIIILESFGKAHIKSLSDQFKPKQETHTPFLDSLFNEGYLFTNAHQNGYRSMDALPAIWASIPTFKEPFLSLPNSVADYHALPACMNEMGYHTAFMHGAVKESMGFVSFGKNLDIKEFQSREEYEEAKGDDDFDGKWGIWDHKFWPFVHEKINVMPKPFFTTVFTLSSHHPFSIPAELKGKFAEGTLPIHRVIKYSDYALKTFFEGIKKEPWYKNTLFVITADHASGADSPKFLKPPFDYSIPILFYHPGKNFKGTDDKIMQHIDIMPTLLGMLDYDKPYFAFGKNHFNKEEQENHFAINFSNSAFNCTTDSYYYQFNEKDILVKSDYRKDPLWKNNLLKCKIPQDEKNVLYFKAFIQQYYSHLNERNFLPQQKSRKAKEIAGRDEDIILKGQETRSLKQKLKLR
ncbi:LTA synthase family protein [uncultured Flavobacterium sp.]|uniref:LTA synthase family protein n=1 Tax=uncultured Flavobacterium sp. TaxID=165435 RepID=UPI00120D4BB7|nr:alkaline phosphatase family protein [uncultured Flavobacterium sp.]THD31415.1 MAG: alkaline phosphatase family protein [Flavobacterium johnsoniae]